MSSGAGKTWIYSRRELTVSLTRPPVSEFTPVQGLSEELAMVLFGELAMVLFPAPVQELAAELAQVQAVVSSLE